MKIIKFVADGIANLIGKAVARCHIDIEQSNAKFREEAKAREYANVAINSSADYELIAEMMAEAINNTVDVTHLLPVRNLSQLFTQHWFGKIPSGIWAFQYQGYYVKGYGMTAEAVQRILQSELNRLCGVYQYPALTIHVTFGANNVVSIKVAFTNALRAAQKVVI